MNCGRNSVRCVRNSVQFVIEVQVKFFLTHKSHKSKEIAHSQKNYDHHTTDFNSIAFFNINPRFFTRDNQIPMLNSMGRFFTRNRDFYISLILCIIINKSLTGYWVLIPTYRNGEIFYTELRFFTYTTANIKIGHLAK